MADPKTEDRKTLSPTNTATKAAPSAQASAKPAEPTRPALVSLRVQTARGIPSRMRCGLRFTDVPATIETDEDAAKIILADIGLVAYRVGGGGDFGEGSNEALELASLRAEVASLRVENVQLATQLKVANARLESE